VKEFVSILSILLSEAGFRPPNGFTADLSAGWIIRPAGGPDLVVEERDDERPHFLQTQRLNISYRAERDLSAVEASIVIGLKEALLRIEREHPGAITSILALAAAGGRTLIGGSDAAATMSEMTAQDSWQGRPPDHLVRLTTACHQRCLFCNTNRSAPDFARTRPAVERRLDDLVRAGAAEVCFTGGEPTLVSDLVDDMAMATSLGLSVALQTNGVKLADPGFAQILKDAGLNRVLVSLHSHRESVSAQLTGVKGDLEKTLVGIFEAHAAGLTVVTNTVITTLNHQDLPDLVSLFEPRGGTFAGAISQMVFSFMAPVARGKKNLAIMARIREVLPELEVAVATAHRVGLRPTIPSICGAPLCALGPEVARFSTELAAAQAGTLAPDRTFLATCADCLYRDRCSGIWKIYLERYGDREFRPIREPIEPTDGLAVVGR